MLCSGVSISFDWLEGVVGTGVHACRPSVFLDWSCLNSVNSVEVSTSGLRLIHWHKM